MSFSSVHEEVDYYDRLLYRLVMTKDEQLEGAVNTHLPTLLEVLATPHEAVRNKVVECCSHILKRIRAQPTLQLPCSLLVSKVKAPSSGAFTRNFAMIFLEIGVARLDPSVKARLGLEIIEGISGLGAFCRHQTALVHRFLDIIEHVPSTPAALAALSDVSPAPSASDLSFLSDLFLDILIVPNAAKLPRPQPPNAPAPLLAPLPGLPRECLERLSSHPTRWDSQATLAKVKLEVIRLLHSPLFGSSPSAILPHLFVASTDSETRVKEKAESLVRLLTDLRQRGAGSAAMAGATAPPAPPLPPQADAADIVEAVRKQQEEAAELRQAEDSRLAGTLLRLYLGGQDCPLGPGPTGTPLYRSPIGEASRVLCLDWAVRECPDALALHEALVSKAILTSLTPADASLPIKAVGARLAAFFASRCRQASFPLIGPLLFAALQQALTSFYQQLTMFRASASSESQDRNSTAREHCYMALTSLAHRLTTANTPELLFANLSLLRLLLHSLTLEGSVQAIRVSEALGAMLTAFTSSTKRLGRPPQDPALLRPLLHAAAQSPQMRARLAAMEWSSQAFPPSDLLFRTMGLQLADDAAQAVRKAAAAAMALGGMEGELPPFPLELDQQEQQQQADLFPPFPALVDALLLDQQAGASLAFPLSRLGRTGEALALYLVWRSLLQEAAGSSSLDAACSRFPDHVTRVLSWIRKGALPEHTSARADRVPVYRAASAFLLGFSRLADPSRLCSFTHDFRWVQGWLAHEDRDVRSATAGFLGRLSLVMDPTQRDVALYTLASAIDTAVTRRDGRAAHGPLLAVGHVHACWLATTTQAGPSPSASDPQPPRPLLPVQLVSLSAAARAAAPTAPDDVHAAGCSSLSLVGTQAPLPLLRPEAQAPATLPPDVRSVDDVVSALVADVSAANGKERRAEAAAACLGCLARQDPGLPRREELIKACVGVGSVRDPELQLAVSEALTGLAAWGVSDVLAPVLEKADDHSPHVRSAAALWLLGLVSDVDRLPALRPKLIDIQPVLVRLLKDDSELTQESSGKALAAAYDASEPDPVLRASLLEALMLSFKGSGDRTALEVNAPSSQAPLPTNVDLGPSHFREVCSLALDLGRPELLYTFLALPANHAAWAGRRASRFLSSSGPGRKRRRREEELQASLEPLLPKIVPRLFRGRFEPSGPARKAMEQLWRVVAAPDPKATVKRFLPQVLHELAGASLGSRKWRERQAAASALAEVLSGRTYEEVRGLLEQLWLGTFRILDDLKESVAMAGLDLAKSLCTLSARLCNRDETPAEQVKDVVGLLLPILLQRGLLEKNKHVQALSVLTLCRVIKGAGECIKPYLADLVSVLIESMSAIEPAELQYMQFHSSSMDMSEEDMEKLRYSLSRSGPLQEALDHCVKHLDSPTITELMPRLLGHLRSGVGLNTRCCAANTVVVLAARFRPEVKPHIPALLQVLAAGALAERSVTAQRHFLGALKSVAKLASEWDNRKLILRLAREYRKCADEVVSRSRRLSVVSVLKELCNASGERLEEATWRPLLPLAYVGKFEQEEAVKEAWLEIWAEGCAALGKEGGNTGRALAVELVQEVEASMRATSWLSRQQSCRAIEDLTAILGPALQPHAFRLARLLLLALPGRLWEGKELALQAMIAICAKAPRMMVLDDEHGQDWLLDTPTEGKTFPQQLRPRLSAGKEEAEDEDEEAAAMDVVVEAEEPGASDGQAAAVPMEGVSPPPPPPAPTQPPAPLAEGEEAGRDETAFEHFVAADEAGAAPSGSGAAEAGSTTPLPASEVTEEPGAGRISVRGLVAVLVHQCRRPSRDYRRAALGCVSQLSLAFPHVPMLAQTQALLRDFAGLERGEEGGGGAEDEDVVSKARAVDALGAVFPVIVMQDMAGGGVALDMDKGAAAYAQQQEALSWLLPGLLPRLTYAVWSFRLAAYQCLRRIMERLYVRSDGSPALGPSLLSSAVVEKVIGACEVGLGDAKYVQVREAALGVLLALVKRPEMEARFAYLPHADQMDRLLSRAKTDNEPSVVMLAVEVTGLLASR